MSLQLPRVPSLIPRSRATSAIGLPVSSTICTASALNCGLNFLRCSGMDRSSQVRGRVQDRWYTPEWPEAALFLQGRYYAWVHTTPYYSCPLWPQFLVAAMERWCNADPNRYPQRQLPCPPLDQLNPETGQYWIEECGSPEIVEG